MLTFELAEWRFETPGPVPVGVRHAFWEYIEVIAQQGDPWTIVETCKSRFGGGGRSSSLDWAWSDLDRIIGGAAENAPTFIEAFYDLCETFKAGGLSVPSLERINRLLAEQNAGFEIRPPNLLTTRSYTSILVPPPTPSLEDQAKQLIDESLAAADLFLEQRQGRRAVQEALWLLETISTAFRGTGSEDETVQGKYFNQIIKELGSRNPGTAQAQILRWMTMLHGFLSSPTGGEVRHGRDLKDGVAIELHEARLYCNLTRSYIGYLIEAHGRLMSRTTVT